MKINWLILEIFNALCLYALAFSLHGAAPFRRGFFCSDESLRYPSKSPEIVSYAGLLVISLLVPVVVVILVEFSLSVRSTNGSVDKLPKAVHNILTVLCEWFTVFSLSMLLVAFTKIMVGRLRPMFFEACNPDVDCGDAKNLHRYITDFKCTNENRSLTSLGKSFPSGHASESMVSMMYLVFYFHKRFAEMPAIRGVILILQISCVIIALFVGLSRIQDYHHHWSDVMAGFIFGAFIAVAGGQTSGKLNRLLPYNKPSRTPAELVGNSVTRSFEKSTKPIEVSINSTR